MTRDEEVDRAYVHGYEQASREWQSCIEEIGAVGWWQGGRISDADLKLRAEALAAVRRGRDSKLQRLNDRGEIPKEDRA